MNDNPWKHLPSEVPTNPRWLDNILADNAQCAYLHNFGSPSNIEEYRSQVPLITYDDLQPWIEQIVNGSPNILFQGTPVAYERTGGSSCGPKLIPYTINGLQDFQNNITPWLSCTVNKYKVSKRAYFSISPVTRRPLTINGVPVGLPDGAYLGHTVGNILKQVSAVPADISVIENVELWRRATLDCLKKLGDQIELISVWSPTFLLDLFRDEYPQVLFPNLKVISCWTSATAAPYSEELKTVFPQSHIQSKGLISTECVVTVPDADENLILANHGFFEFKIDNQVMLENQLVLGSTYEIVATTASGLYRYCTGDFVTFEGINSNRRPILKFIGRGRLTSDLVGEKLSEPFVAGCLENIKGFRMLIPDQINRCYCLVVDSQNISITGEDIENRLSKNPQYAYARKIGQLNKLKVIVQNNAKDIYVNYALEQGVRLGDIKPVAMRNEFEWISRFLEA